MKRRLPGPDRSLPLTLVLLALAVMLVLVSLAPAACGTDVGARTTTLETGLTTTTTTAVSTRETVMDTGYTTTSTPPPSVPALASGITTEQVVDLVARNSNLSPGDWKVRECKNLGDWAAAKLYTDRFPAQMDERGVAAVFKKSGSAWFFKGWVSLSDPANEPIELANMNAPAEVWDYFDLNQVSAAELFPPEQMPADFGFTAAYGVMGRNEIDTFAGTFTKDLGLTEERPTTLLSLSHDALQTLYRDLVLMQKQWQLFTTAFAPDPDPENTGTTTYTYTFDTYRLEWRAAGFSSLPIVWEDSALSADPKAVALRGWFKKLQQMIEATPQWRLLPPMTGGYE